MFLPEKITLPIDVEGLLWDEFTTYLKRGRRGDLEHSRRALDCGKYLCSKEGGDSYTVETALIVHDIGYHKVIQQFSENQLGKYWPNHMGEGAFLAWQTLPKIAGQSSRVRNILTDERIKKIVNIVAMHDNPDDVFEIGDRDAIIVVEADRLDRYNLRRVDEMKDFYPDSCAVVDTFGWLGQGLNDWFVTKTGRALALELYNTLADEISKK